MAYRVHWLETGEAFDVEPEEAVLAAALRQQVDLPHECRLGGCGSCRLKVVEGVVRYDELPLALTPQEDAEGFALACQALPASDLVISIDPPCAASPPARAAAVVEAVRPLTSDVLHLRLTLPGQPPLAYLPGQYMNILLPDGRHRSFSMASKPDGASLDFHVRQVPGGWFTGQRLPQLQAGETLEVEVPLGRFRYHPEDYRPLLMVATGTGLAPLKSMLEALMDDPDCPPVSLYWGMRSQADLYLHEEIQSWADRLYEFQYVPVLSRPQAGWNGRQGYVQQAVLQDLGDLSEHAIYLCGSPGMIADAKAAFAAHGASLDYLYADSFAFQST